VELRGKWVIIAAVIILGSIGIGALSSLYGPKRPLPKDTSKTVAQPVDPFPSGAVISLQGKVEAQQVVSVGAKVNGQLSELYFEPGQEVYEGQLIAKVRNRKLESERDRANEDLEAIQTRLSNAESSMLAARLEGSRARAEASRFNDDLSRLQKIYDRQVLLNNQQATPRNKFEQAKRDYEEAKASATSTSGKADIAEQQVAKLTREIDSAKKALEEKQAALEEAESDLKAADITSPVDGIFLSSGVEPGEEVTRSMEDLFQIAVDLSRMQVIVEPTPEQMTKMKLGLPVQVFMAEAAGEALPGEISLIQDNYVTIVFQSPTAAIKPGLTAQVRIKLP
jgi:HlyD family secretion protein